MQNGTTVAIRLVENEDELLKIFPVMQELRPHLDAATFIARAKTARSENFRVAALYDNGACVAVAGFRFMTSLNTGITVYIDDLVTTASRRGQGYGEQLFHFICEEGRRQNCGVITLDSGYQRRDAHRFYLNRGMAMVSHHFAMKLG